MTALTIHETSGPFHATLTPGRWVVFVTSGRQRLAAVRRRAGVWESFDLEPDVVAGLWQVSTWTTPDVDAVQVAVDRGVCTAIVHDGEELVEVVAFKGEGRWWKR